MTCRDSYDAGPSAVRVDLFAHAGGGPPAHHDIARAAEGAAGRGARRPGYRILVDSASSFWCDASGPNSTREHLMLVDRRSGRILGVEPNISERAVRKCDSILLVVRG